MWAVDTPASSARPVKFFGRYAVYDPIASGGMATVHLGRQLGHEGFSRTVAIKRLHPHLAAEQRFVNMLIDEARLVSRIRHPNVVQTLDIVAEGGEVFLVLDYVHGEALSRLIQTAQDSGKTIPLPIISAIVGAILYGLDAGHEARDESGRPLGIVHRDVSPHNIVVGVDGVARLLDFGVAKAANRLQTTREGQIKGKLAFLAPEMAKREEVTRRADIFAAGAVLWECLTMRRLFDAASEAGVVAQVLICLVDAPSKFVPSLSDDLDRLVLRALNENPAKRFATAGEMAATLHALIPPALNAEVGAWVAEIAVDTLAKRSAALTAIESTPDAPSVPVVEGLHREETLMSVVTGERESSDGAEEFAARRRRKRTFALGLLVGALGALALVGATLLRHPPGQPTVSAAAAEMPSEGAARGIPSASAPEAEPSPPPSSAAASASGETAAASASVGALGATSAAPPNSDRGRARIDAPRAGQHAKKPASAKLDCTETFTRNSMGMKIYNRDCLR